jgi:hypothetical protein
VGQIASCEYTNGFFTINCDDGAGGTSKSSTNCDDPTCSGSTNTCYPPCCAKGKQVCEIYCKGDTAPRTVDCTASGRIDQCVYSDSWGVLEIHCIDRSSQNWVEEIANCEKPIKCDSGGTSTACATECKKTTGFTDGQCIGSAGKCVDGSAPAADPSCVPTMGTGAKCCCVKGTSNNECVDACKAVPGKAYTDGQCVGSAGSCNTGGATAGDASCVKTFGTGAKCCCSGSTTGTCKMTTTTDNAPCCDDPTHTGSSCLEDRCINGVMKTYRCDAAGKTCVAQPDQNCKSGACDPNSKGVSDPSTFHACKSNCKLISNTYGTTTCVDDANPNGLADYCSGDKQYHYDCNPSGKCTVNTGTACPNPPGKCEDKKDHGASGGLWSEKCATTATPTDTMTIKVDAKTVSGKTQVLSCQQVTNIKVSALDSKNQGIKAITITMSSNPAMTFNLASGDTNNDGAFFTGFKAPKVDSDGTLTITASGHDKNNKYKDATGQDTLPIKPNKLKLYPYTNPNLYVWSTATKLGTAKSCEDITFGACVLDAENKKPTLPVTITFQFQDDTRKEEIKCTAPANNGCCTMAYTAPANTGAAKDFHLTVKATEPTCYSDAEPVPVTLNVAPVQLVITELKTDAPTAGVQAGKDVKAWAIVKNGKDASAKPVKDVEVTFTLKGPVTLTKVGTTGSDGKATVTFTPTVAGDYTLTAIAKVKAVAPAVSCYTDSIETTAADKVKVTEPPGCDTLCSNEFVCVSTSQGCASGQTAKSDGNAWCKSKFSKDLCCCKA